MKTPDEASETPVEVLVSETWIPARMHVLFEQQEHPYYGCAIVFMSYDAYKAAKGESTQPSCGWLMDQRPIEQVEGEIKCVIKPPFWRLVGAEKPQWAKDLEVGWRDPES